MNRVCAIPYTLDRLKAPVFYPHLFEVACQASRYRWDCETVKDCIGLRGCFTESNCKMWVKDRSLDLGCMAQPLAYYTSPCYSINMNNRPYALSCIISSAHELRNEVLEGDYTFG